MKKHHKILTIVCAVLLVVTSVLGTLAYFTDNDAAVNTFTVGKVGIDLNESDADNDGNFKANAYHLLPGQSYVKDPTVTVDADSEAAYIRMLVTPSDMDALKAAFPGNEADGVFLLQNLVAGWNPEIWEFAGYANGTYEFRYYTTVSTVGSTALTLAPLFTHVVVPGEIDEAHLSKLDGITIDVVAHAIQAAGFDTAELAWAAFATQHP